MPRPPLPIGSWGKISRTPVHREKIVKLDGKPGYRDIALVKHEGKHYAQVDADHLTPLSVSGHMARARYRGADGATKRVEAWGTSAAAAERSLITAMTSRRPSSNGAVNGDTTVAELWTAYEKYLISEDRAVRTMDTYRPIAEQIKKAMGQVRLREANTQRIGEFIDAIAETRGPTTAKTARSILSGMFGLAARFSAVDVNPVREVRVVRAKPKRKQTLRPDDIRAIITAVRESKIPLPAKKGAAKQTSRISISGYCAEADLTDPITFLAGTGVRIGECVGLRWSDVDLDAGTASIEGHVIYSIGQGMLWIDGAKSGAGTRVLRLPDFVVSMLKARKKTAEPNKLDAIFANEKGKWRDPNVLRGQWRRVREAIGYSEVSTHDFRRAVATLLDEEGLTSRVAADQLGHSKVSMTTDKYFGRGRVHDAAAEAIDRSIGLGTDG